jgi:hypothetical protein
MSDGERGHRCSGTNSPLGGARWFEGGRPLPTAMFDPTANALKNGRMFSMPGLLIRTSVREFVDLSQQRTQVAHPRRETRGTYPKCRYISIMGRGAGKSGEQRRDGGRQPSSHGAIIPAVEFIPHDVHAN